MELLVDTEDVRGDHGREDAMDVLDTLLLDIDEDEGTGGISA